MKIAYEEPAMKVTNQSPNEHPFAEEFIEWQNTFMGNAASDTSILHFEMYQPLLIERLRRAFYAGVESALKGDDDEKA